MKQQERKTAQRQPFWQSRRISAIVGGTLLALGCIWLLSLVLQHQGGLKVSWPIPGGAPSGNTISQYPSLSAAGVTLRTPSQTSPLNQQQAVFLANQLEPDAATRAQGNHTQYVLLSYHSTTVPPARPDLNGVPAWLVLYQHISLQPADAAVDPTPLPQAYHDLYVFLDASNGKELLAVWV